MDDEEDVHFFRNYASGAANAPSRRTGPTAPRRSASPNPFDSDADGPARHFNDQADEEETPLQQLIRHWMNERHAPDLLPAQQVLLAGLLDHIHRQVRLSLRLNMNVNNGLLDRLIQCKRCARTRRLQRKIISGLCSCRPRSNASNSL